MKDILTVADEMMLSINESDIYKNYISAKEKIKADNDLFEKMKEFKRAHVKLQGKMINEAGIDFDEEIKVSRMYFSLMHNDLAKEYFKREQELLVLISEIYSKLGNQCSKLLDEF